MAMYPTRKIPSSSSNAGMTLVEIMVSLAVGVIVIGAATWFITEGMKASYKATANVENSIQQWGLATKLQIDGKIASNVTIFASADQTKWDAAGLPVVVGIDDGTPPLERGKILVLTKTNLVQGVDSGVVTDIVYYLFTGDNSTPATGTLKRCPRNPMKTFQVTTTMAVDGAGKPKSVAQLVCDNFSALNGTDLGLVQDHVRSIDAKGPFAHLGSLGNASIALVREENDGGPVATSANLSEVSFNIR
jgi:prepilin-type N-terminal cleavage/methylation domain-containing protein